MRYFINVMSIDQCLNDPFLILMMFEVKITLPKNRICRYYFSAPSFKKCDDFEGVWWRGVMIFFSFPESQLMAESNLWAFYIFACLLLLKDISLIEFYFIPHPPPSVNTEKGANNLFSVFIWDAVAICTSCSSTAVEPPNVFSLPNCFLGLDPLWSIEAVGANG